MTEAMPFLQKTILLSYDPRPSSRGAFFMLGYSVITRGTRLEMPQMIS